MIESMLIVLSRPLDGRHDELNDWYTNIHIRDALRFRGSIATQRFALTDERPGPRPQDWSWTYLALYECYDTARFTREHFEAADSVRMEITEAFDNSEINDFYYFPLAWRTNDETASRSGGVIVEFLNPTEGREVDFRAFYEAHLAEASRRPGVHSAAFLAYRPAGQLMPYPPAHRYLAVYWTVDDAAAVAAWAADTTLASEPSVDQDSLIVLPWRPITRRLTRDDIAHTTSADLAAEEQARANLKRRDRKGRSTREAMGLG